MRGHRLHEAEARLLDFLLLVVLHLHALLVLGLQALEELLEVGLRLFHLTVLLLYLCLQVGVEHGHEFVELLLFLRVAEVWIIGPAARAQIVLRKRLQFLKVTAALVVFQVVGVSIFDGGEPFYADLLAQVLAASGAVHIGDQNVRGVLVLLHQFVPSGLHALAVASPRRQKLHEDRLPGRFLIPILFGELDATRRGGERQNNKHRGLHGFRSL
mmetsp:Transcript_67140/g.151762  ORF Transcript_67140/g.151762 Transcript_67140/m.151762 type:complete len:214 (+) Transcript_67140:145-786(+)